MESCVGAGTMNLTNVTDICLFKLLFRKRHDLRINTSNKSKNSSALCSLNDEAINLHLHGHNSCVK